MTIVSDRYLYKFVLVATPLLAFLLAPAPVRADEEGWQSLIVSQDLSEWELFSGTAPHVREGDMIVGTSKLEPFHTFFATKARYSDFILELEMQLDPRLNSGVQIRCADSSSAVRPTGGYHIDIDPTVKHETGIIWENTPARWQQRYPRSAAPQAFTAFRNGDWNRIRIEALGPSIRVWLNGIQTANLVDEHSREGFIALHIHPIRSEELAGLHTRWRNIRIKTDNLAASAWPVDPQVREISYLVNQLTEAEKRKGYRLLWDGNSFDGWKDVNKGGISAADWKIVDGALTVVPGKNPAHEGPPGGLITEQLFGNFELEWEFKISKGANSGIKYFVDPKLAQEQGLGMGLEYQILDDENSEYASQGTNGNRKLASAIDLISPRPLTNSNMTMKKLFWGLDVWNRGRIVSRDGKIEHWLNNEKVVEFDRNSQLFDALVPLSMHSKWPAYGKLAEGHILLQDFDQDVAFRSIKIREF